MIFKVMTCRAPDRQAFDRAQRPWAALGRVNGFIAQFGGWDTAKPDRVLLLALWHDLAAYDAFMRAEHDTIHEGSSQARTYENLETTLAEPIDTACPDHGAPELTAAIRSAGFIRMASCEVRPGRAEHFLEAQRTVWNPGMLGAGALAVWPVRSRADTSRYLVVSLWESAEAHERYRTGVFAELRRRAQPDADLRTLRGWAASLVPEWTVR